MLKILSVQEGLLTTSVHVYLETNPGSHYLSSYRSCTCGTRYQHERQSLLKLRIKADEKNFVLMTRDWRRTGRWMDV